MKIHKNVRSSILVLATEWGSTPHAVNEIIDANNNSTHSMNWDANGNMTHLSQPSIGMDRKMCWDEENRLTVVKDPEQFNHYIYTAGGERVWKFTGDIERMTINGEDFIDVALLDKTLYSSPYLILTERRCFKRQAISPQTTMLRPASVPRTGVEPRTF